MIGTCCYMLLPLCVLLTLLWTGGGHAMTTSQIADLRNEVESMFYHGYDNYMKHAFPEDEIRPDSCTPLTRDHHDPGHTEVNDALGNYSLTLVDNLSTLAILASSPSKLRSRNKALIHFKSGVRAIVEQYGDGTEGPGGLGKRARGFDLDSKIQVFETVIRGVGGLLSAHLFAVGDLPAKDYDPSSQRQTKISKTGRVEAVRWSRSFTYDGQLLRLALDLATRLLPAFESSTGIPYPRVNLRHGVPFYANSPLNQAAEAGQCPTSPPSEDTPAEAVENCSAGAGSLVLEFTLLSRLTGDERFERLAKRAFWAIWERRTAVGLVGSGIDAETGQWTTPFTGIGAGIDSFYEYAAKAGVFLAGEESAAAFHEAWSKSHAAIKRHLYRGEQYIHPHYIQGDVHNGAARAFWLDSLSAFYPGLLVLAGELEEAISTHLLFSALWARYSALPERWNVHDGNIEGGLRWWVGRPEFIESTYHLYRATQDPWYLHVGEMVLRDIKRRCRAKCGWSGVGDVRLGDHNDRMETFFLSETFKYLFLLFDPDHALNRLDAPFVFSTEGHPLIIPHYTSRNKSSSTYQGQCPVPKTSIPLTRSATAARKDYFHAAKLARLHKMPRVEDIDSPLVEFSQDHPSITLSDVRSPSNYTHYPWTLPLDLIPVDAVSAPIPHRPTFDITFPQPQNGLVQPGSLSRVTEGILINAMGGIRLGMIQEQSNVGEEYRVQLINNLILGKDERVFLSKDTIANLVDPHDPNFTSVRDPVMLDLAIDVASTNDTLDALIGHLASLVGRSKPEPPSRKRIPAILPMGPGAAPLPDYEDASRTSALWKSIYIGDNNCNGPLSPQVPRNTQVLVIKRGTCSFSDKLKNIPMFSPSKTSLKLVVVVSFDEEEDDGVPPGWLIRPFLDAAQTTLSGLARHNPIPLVMVSGGEDTYDLFRKAVGVGIRRRYSIQAQGIPISNLVII